MDPEWVDVFAIENHDIPAITMLVYQRVTNQNQDFQVPKMQES